jgi:hypothetical protein
MHLKDIKVGEVYLLDDFDTVEQGELVEIIKVYDNRTPYQVSDLESQISRLQVIFDGFSPAIYTGVYYC